MMSSFLKYERKYDFKVRFVIAVNQNKKAFPVIGNFSSFVGKINQPKLMWKNN